MLREGSNFLASFHHSKPHCELITGMATPTPILKSPTPSRGLSEWHMTTSNKISLRPSLSTKRAPNSECGGILPAIFLSVALSLDGLSPHWRPIAPSSQPRSLGSTRFTTTSMETSSWRRGVGLDWRVTKQLFAGAEATWRDLRVPFIVNADTAVFEGWEEQVHRAYISGLQLSAYRLAGNWCTTHLRQRVVSSPAVL